MQPRIAGKIVPWVVVGLALATSLVSAAPDAPRATATRVRLPGLRSSGAVHRALSGARKRLQRPSCQRLFRDYEDGAGRPLQDALDREGTSGDQYLDLLVFYDGAEQPQCARPRVLAFTAPTSKVIFVCPEQFATASLHDPRLAEAALIHESLHSLGLLENPPTSASITSQVLSRCVS